MTYLFISDRKTKKFKDLRTDIEIFKENRKTALTCKQANKEIFHHISKCPRELIVDNQALTKHVFEYGTLKESDFNLTLTPYVM